MNIVLQDHAKVLAEELLQDHPVFPEYTDHLTILVVGSIGAGFSDEFSDVDFWFLCADKYVDEIREKFHKVGLRFDELPPELISSGSIEAHYFTFPISKFQQGLQIGDDQCMFFGAFGLVIHDPSQQFAALRSQCINIPEELVHNKVGVAYSRVIQCSFEIRKRIKRFQPLCWIQYSHDIMKWALELCCWLDRKPPIYSSWLFKQAQSCSTVSIIMPAIEQVMRAIGPAIEKGLTDNDCGSSLMEAVEALESAVGKAVQIAGFGDVPRWSPEDMHG